MPETSFLNPVTPCAENIDEFVAHLTDKGASPAFRESIIEAWEELPPDVARFLLDHGNTVSIAKTLSDICPDQKYMFIVSNADDPRIHIDQAPGQSGGRNIDLAEYFYNDSITFKIAPINTSTSSLPEEQLRYSADLQHAVEENCPGLLDEDPDMTDPNWYKVSSERTEQTFCHEEGHCIFDAANIGADPSFDDAYGLDVAALGGPDAARDKGMGYFIQDPDSARGETEAFAQAFMSAIDKDGADANFSKCFPHVCAWVKEYLGNFDYYQSPSASQISFPMDRGINTTGLGNASPLSDVTDAFSQATMHVQFAPSLRFMVASAFLALAYVQYYRGFCGTKRQFVASLVRRKSSPKSPNRKNKKRFRRQDLDL